MVRASHLVRITLFDPGALRGLSPFLSLARPHMKCFAGMTWDPAFGIHTVQVNRALV
jgi:hypothetical protein